MSLSLTQINNIITLKGNNATFFATLDGNRCRTEKALLHELAMVFRFPEPQTGNFDTLFDCLTDLEWLGVDSIYLLIIHPALICADQESKRPLETFLHILKDVLAEFQQHPIHFHLIAEKSFLQLLN